MDPLWLLKGDRFAPGWKLLEEESKADKVNLLVFDRQGWALVRAVEPPTKYEGMEPTEPADGLYVSEQGYPIYVVSCKEVARPEDVIQALGKEAEDMLEELGDPVVVLQRLGKAY